MLRIVVARTVDYVSRCAAAANGGGDCSDRDNKYLCDFVRTMDRLTADAASADASGKYTSKFLSACDKWVAKAPGDAARTVLRAAQMSAQTLLILAPFVSVRPPYIVLDAPLDALTAAITAALNPEQGKTLTSLRAELTGLVAPLFVCGSLSFPWKRLFAGPPARLMSALRAYTPTLSDAPRTVPWTPMELQRGYADAPAAFALFALHQSSQQQQQHKPPGDSSSAKRARVAGQTKRARPHAHPQHLAFVTTAADYVNINCLMDCYTEEQRLSARRSDTSQSPLAMWRSDVSCVASVLKQCGGDWTPGTMRDTFYLIARECTQFQPTLALCVYRMLSARRILDPCAGWGDRLAGAVAHADTQRYLAFDPNTALRDGHAQFVGDHVAKQLRDRFEVRYEPFERADLSAEQPFDLVFTSPPFFDLEEYTTTEPGQSLASFPTLDAWLAGFLDVLVTKSWAALAPGGNFVLHFADTQRTQAVARVHHIITARLGGDYRGVVHSVTATGQPRPMWVFRK